MFVRPLADRRVVRPDTLVPLSADGEHVPASDYWLRRLAGGDVEECDAPSETPVATKPSRATSAPVAVSSKSET